MKTRELKPPSDTVYGSCRYGTRFVPSGGGFFVPMKNTKSSPIGEKSVKPRKAAAREKLITVNELDHKTGKVISEWKWPKHTVDYTIKLAKEKGVTFSDIVREAVQGAFKPEMPEEMAAYITKHRGRVVKGDLIMAPPGWIVWRLKRAFEALEGSTEPGDMTTRLCFAEAARIVCGKRKAVQA